MILTLAFHPYDYPEIGIRLRTCDVTRCCLITCTRPQRGGLRRFCGAVLKDIESGVVTRRQAGARQCEPVVVGLSGR